jgi:hypothetical protein
VNSVRSRDPYFTLLLVALGSVVVHGYHLGTDDAAIYVPAVKKAFDPQLYPYGAEFFEHHGRLSIFSSLVAGTAKLGHMPIDAAIFLWHIFGIFLMMLAAWRLASLCFQTARARWSAVLMSAVVLTVPVAGTALVIMDPYLTARSLSTPATMLAIASFMDSRWKQMIAWLALTAVVHPQNAAYGIAFCILMALPMQWLAFSTEASPAFAMFSDRLPTGFDFNPAQGTYHDVLYMRSFFFAQFWTWYEWIGVIAPMGILYWFSRTNPRGTLSGFHKVSRALIPFGLLITLVFLVMCSTPHLEMFIRLQPMRGFLLLYILLFLLIGGLIGEYFLQNKTWRWMALFVPLFAGMMLIQRNAYARSPHIEFPWQQGKNEWVQALYWIRDNTPKDAVFAVDPRYIILPAVDQHGFRAIAERSVLSDYYKDSGAVSLFPTLADEWAQEQKAQAGFPNFHIADFQRLAQQYPVTWVVVQTPPLPGLDCPYHNSSVSVCRIPAASSQR